jgi:hypothetical protein
MNNDIKEIIKLSLLGVIAITVVYGVFFKKEKRRVDPNTYSNYTPNPQVNQPMNSGSSTYFGPEENMNVSTTINRDQAIDATPQPLDVPATNVAFNEQTWDFGTVEQNTENLHIFAFTNTGTNPLIIENAEGSCGCTVPEYPREPIPPGGSGEIKVKYSPGQQIGQQNKTVSITANTPERVMQLNISAVVVEQGAGS